MLERGNPGRLEYINHITKQLGSMAIDAKISSKGNRNDMAVVSEETVRGLLNLMWNYKLINANGKSLSNSPSVDLEDEENGVAVQVTVERSLRKVDDMLRTFQKNNLDQKFDKLILLILSLDEPTIDMKKRESSYFSGKEDIWNIPRLMRTIEHEDSVDKLRKISEYLDKELGFLPLGYQNTDDKKEPPNCRPEKSPRGSAKIIWCLALVAAIICGCITYGQYKRRMTMRNTLMKNAFSSVESEQEESAFNTSVKRKEIRTITFLDSLALVPDDTSDASQLQNGRVRAWVTPSDNLYDLYIAADGVVDAPKNSDNLFRGMVNLTEVNFNDAFSTRNAESMQSMFSDCWSLKKLKISIFDTAQVSNMAFMFDNCVTLGELDLSSFDTSNVTNMESMFNNCSALKTLDISSFVTTHVTSMNSMFSGCSDLEALNISNFDTANVTSMAFMFDYCCSLTNLDLRHFDTAQVEAMNSMFRGCEQLTQLDVSNFDTFNVTNMASMFAECSNLETLNISSFDTANVASMEKMFMCCCSLLDLDVTHFDTAQVEAMNSMFRGCEQLIQLDVSNFDTSNVTNMGTMFAGCSALETLDISSFDTANVTDMSFMFSLCRSLTDLDVSHFDTAQVIDMHNMFSDCVQLTELDVSSFDTTQVVDMSDLFFGCDRLTALDVSGFQMGHVTNVSGMFFLCPELADQNFSEWDLSAVVEYQNFMDYGRTVNGRPWEELFV